MQAGRLATQSLNILFQYASVLRGSTPGTHCSPGAMGATLRDSALSRRTVMNNVG